MSTWAAHTLKSRVAFIAALTGEPDPTAWTSCYSGRPVTCWPWEVSVQILFNWAFITVELETVVNSGMRWFQKLHSWCQGWNAFGSRDGVGTHVVSVVSPFLAFPPASQTTAADGPAEESHFPSDSRVARSSRSGWSAEDRKEWSGISAGKYSGETWQREFT